MTQAIFGRFFSAKTLIRVAFAALSLSFGIANAAARSTGSSQGGDAYSLVRGGGG